MGRGGWWSGGLCLLLALCLAACSARRAVHEVRHGETLSQIGLAYGVPYREIARANRLRDPSRIYVGQRLVIPKPRRRGVAATPPAAATLLPRRGHRRDAAAIAPAAARAGGGRSPDAPGLQWPLSSGTVTSGFGPRGAKHHDGIDIAAPFGAPIRAAADGEVVYSASLPGYGNVIVLRHASGYTTLYAHNERHHVRDGQRVRRGQLIATVGRSGRATATNLHFEVRKDNVPRDPLDFLSPALQVLRNPDGADGG
jgi:lipoprotein NlpD